MAAAFRRQLDNTDARGIIFASKDLNLQILAANNDGIFRLMIDLFLDDDHENFTFMYDSNHKEITGYEDYVPENAFRHILKLMEIGQTGELRTSRGTVSARLGYFRDR
jgi:hypothetical protein